MMEFIAHTIPAVNIASKKKFTIQNDGRKYCDRPPKTNDIKNPTHVLVQSVHPTKSPKNFDFPFMYNLVLSNIEPHTIIEVIP
jgi:hypothetical protein